jgi:hypothetical protein
LQKVKVSEEGFTMEEVEKKLISMYEEQQAKASTEEQEKSSETSMEVASEPQEDEEERMMRRSFIYGRPTYGRRFRYPLLPSYGFPLLPSYGSPLLRPYGMRSFGLRPYGFPRRMRTFAMRSSYGFPLSGYGYGMPLTYGMRNLALPLRSHKRLSYGLLHRPRYSDEEAEEKEIEEETEEEEAKADETEEEERSHYGLTYGLPSYGRRHGLTYGLSSYGLGYGRPSFRHGYGLSGYGSSTYGFPSYGRFGRTTGYGDEEEQEVADEEEEKFEDVEPESEEKSELESEEERNGVYGGYGGFRVSKFAKSAPCVNKFNMPVPCAGYGYGKMTYGRFPFRNFY